MYSAGSYQILLDNPTLFLISAFSGFFINLCSFLLVKRTSGITLKLITMARNGGLVLASALCFGETITTLETVGYAGLLFFFGAYTVIKQQESVEAGWAVAPLGTGLKRVPHLSADFELGNRDADSRLKLLSSNGSILTDD